MWRRWVGGERRGEGEEAGVHHRHLSQVEPEGRRASIERAAEGAPAMVQTLEVWDLTWLGLSGDQAVSGEARVLP